MLADPAESIEHRMGAALALREVDADGAGERIRFAAEASANSRIRIALLSTLEDEEHALVGPHRTPVHEAAPLEGFRRRHFDLDHDRLGALGLEEHSSPTQADTRMGRPRLQLHGGRLAL